MSSGNNPWGPGGLLDYSSKTELTKDSVELGLPLEVPRQPTTATARAFGTWNGITLDLEKSINGTQWQVARDIDGFPIVFTEDGFQEVETPAKFYRVSVTPDIDFLIWFEIGMASVVE